MNKEHWVNCILAKITNELTPGDLVCITHIDEEKVSE